MSAIAVRFRLEGLLRRLADLRQWRHERAGAFSGVRVIWHADQLTDCATTTREKPIVNMNWGAIAAVGSVIAGVAYLTARIDAAEARLTKSVDEVRADLTKSVDEVRTDLTKSIDEVRTDLTKSIDEVRTDLTKSIDEVKTDLTKSVDEVKTDLTKSVDEVKADLKAHERRYAERDREVAEILGGLVTAVTHEIPLKKET